MNNYTNYAAIIKNALAMHQMLEFYGFDIRHNRIPCPFHNGKNRNLGIKNDYYKCFVCGETGDIIDFVMKYFQIDFQTAVEKLNRDFNLGLNIGQKPSLRSNREQKERIRKFTETARAKQIERENLIAEREAALDEYVKLTQDTIEHRPKSVSDMDNPHPLYIYAIFHINEALLRLEQAEERLYQYEHQ